MDAYDSGCRMPLPFLSHEGCWEGVVVGRDHDIAPRNTIPQKPSVMYANTSHLHLSREPKLEVEQRRCMCSMADKDSSYLGLVTRSRYVGKPGIGHEDQKGKRYLRSSTNILTLNIPPYYDQYTAPRRTRPPP